MPPMHKVMIRQVQSAAQSFSRFSAARPELVQTCAGAMTWCAHRVVWLCACAYFACPAWSARMVAVFPHLCIKPRARARNKQQ